MISKLGDSHMKKKLLAVAAAVATLPAAYAVDFKAGNWDLSLSGNANAFYTATTCSGDTVSGLAMGSKALACGGSSKSTTIGNGLLPNQLNFGAKTKEGGYDITGVFGISAAVASNSSLNQNSVVDVRTAYFTIGNGEMGTVKMGRDYGLFGANVIFNDMTLLGVGVASQAFQSNRVAAGHIGAGYAYTGNYGQITYSTPKFSNVTVDVGLMSPVDPYLASNTATDTKKGSSAGVQARATYDAGQGIKLYVSNKSQDFQSATKPYRMNASEVGAILGSGPFGFLANYMSGNGLGVLSDGDQGDIKTSHTLLQATYKATSKLKLGLGVGKTTNDKQPGTDTLKSNDNTTVAAYYNLTPSFTLVSEVGTTKSKGFDGTQAKQNNISVGGVFFY
jgi:predicted porin